MARDEKKAYIARIKALKKKEKQGTATSSELWELTDYYNESAKCFLASPPCSFSAAALPARRQVLPFA